MHVPDSKIKVSVSIITYNHEKYIAKAIEGVLMQNVNFNYEIIIGDDCSSDNTQKIIKRYAAAHPDKIQLILHPRRYDNIPGRINNITNLYACRGKYIAMLDGDDYWISKDKLQKQVDFLDNHPDFSLCFHDAEIVKTSAKVPDASVRLFSDRKALANGKTEFDLQEMIQAGYIAQTSSTVFWNLPFGEFPEWFWQVYSADTALQFLLLHHGKAKFIKGLKSAYLINPTGFSKTNEKNDDYHLVQIQNIELLLKHIYINKKSERLVQSKLAQRYFKQAIRDFKNRRFLNTVKHYYKHRLFNYKSKLKTT